MLPIGPASVPGHARVYRLTVVSFQTSVFSMDFFLFCWGWIGLVLRCLFTCACACACVRVEESGGGREREREREMGY